MPTTEEILMTVTGPHAQQLCLPPLDQRRVFKHLETMTVFLLAHSNLYFKDASSTLFILFFKTKEPLHNYKTR